MTVFKKLTKRGIRMKKHSDSSLRQIAEAGSLSSAAAKHELLTRARAK